MIKSILIIQNGSESQIDAQGFENLKYEINFEKVILDTKKPPWIIPKWGHKKEV